MIELEQLAAAHRGGRPFVLATVVRTSGSTYRRAGARMIMCDDARRAGAISGGCLEGDVVKKAWWRTAGGPTLVRYDSTVEADDDLSWGFGLGCNGVIDVLLERVTPNEPGDPIAFLRRCLERRKTGVMVTVISGDALGRRLFCDDEGVLYSALPAPLGAEAMRSARVALDGGRSLYRTHGDCELFVEVIAPPQPLVIFGEGYDVVPLVQQAKALGWHVTVVARRKSAQQRFALADAVVIGGAELELEPRTAAVVMTHNYETDAALLAALIARPIAYLGVLGPRTRTERILSSLQRAPTARELARLHAPVGLDLGAEGADEIALSIVAEVQSLVARRASRSAPRSEATTLELEVAR